MLCLCVCLSVRNQCFITSVSCRRWTGTTSYLARVMLYREVDAQCDKLAKVVRRVLTVTVYRIHTHIHTSKSAPRSGYLTFNGPLSGTTRVSRYQKGKTSLDFTGARDSEWQWHQLGRMQVCTLLQADYHASTPPLSFFTGRMTFRPPNHQHQSTVCCLCIVYNGSKSCTGAKSAP